MNSARDAAPGPADRVRAARVLARLSRRDLAIRLGFSFNTLERIETGHRAVTADELERIGAECNVPAWFMLEGFAGGERRFVDALDNLSEEIRRLAPPRQRGNGE